MQNDQIEIGAEFRTLHQQSGAFVIPNPWDIGSAKILASMGFKALATTSAGMAFAYGVQEGGVSKEQTLIHCGDIACATALPVSADLEKGFGDSPKCVAQCIRDAAQVGLAGCSIEDHTNDPSDPIFDFNLAVERIAAAAESCRALAKDFVLTARCENLLWGKMDLDDTLKRLDAYGCAGADVLYAPGLYDIETIATVCAGLNKPVNVVMGMPGNTLGIKELQDAGVKRISVGSAMARVAYGSFVNAAEEIRTQGSFTFSEKAIGFSEMEQFFS